MGDRMTPIPFGNLMDWVLTEKKKYGKVFGVRRPYKAIQGKVLTIFKERIETPFGPAAGPNTQLAQNIIAAYYAGSRFFELKTVQVIDGEDLPVAKPCILADDECYNCEWSTELRVPDALNEYVKAFVALKVISKEYALGGSDGFSFNMSVGYDLKGIQSEKINTFIDQIKDAGDTPVFKESIAWLKANIDRFEKVTLADVESIESVICTSATVSTLHGCPPAEIERIASYLIEEKNLHTFIKCNPTLLGYEDARAIMDEMGYDYVVFGDFHFKDDLQFEDAVPMLKRLQELCNEKGLQFGVKITNTFPVDVTRNELPSEEMYMSGKSLCALSLSVAYKLSKAFDGKLRISYSGGADYFNIDSIFSLGIWPVTIATTLLKPGGYQRGTQIAEKLEKLAYKPFTGIDVEGLHTLIQTIKTDLHHVKAAKPLPNRKMDQKVPLLDCFTAPCSEGCPIGQDIPAYVKLVTERKFEEALRIILDKNPLPFITGTICNHRCMSKCTRNFYEEPVAIRDAKLVAAQKGYECVVDSLTNGIAGIPGISADLASAEGKVQENSKNEVLNKKVAVVGGGPAGIASAFFLARAGAQVSVFEKSDVLGGVVKQVIPAFRIADSEIDKDIELAKRFGVKFFVNHPIDDVVKLKEDGYDAVILAVGANKGLPIGVQTEKELNAIEFLRTAKSNPDSLKLGKHVVVIGAGNTAMDAARAAKRIEGVETVSVVYRRTKRYMPADEEELLFALEDGVELKELLAPVEQKDGKLLCKKVVLGEMDASGRRKPVETDETVCVKADTIIASLGERVDADYYKKLGLELTDKGNPILNETTRETSIPNVYAVGDGAKGPATVVMAIKDASLAVNHIAGLHERAKIILKTDVLNAAAKKGILAHYEETARTEQGGDSNFLYGRYREEDAIIHGYQDEQRCLECNHICEVCVDVCPNRANVAIAIPASAMPAIIHVDYMCNECGNCKSFCPYDSAPYLEKFTLFANEADFENSKNEGFAILDLESLKVKVRLGGTVEEETLTNSDCKLDEGLKKVIVAVKNNYSYLLG
ncbi:putative selenate reductase subunit YgfK [Lachnospiraceae bacterium ZAX-1]